MGVQTPDVLLRSDCMLALLPKTPGLQPSTLKVYLLLQTHGFPKVMGVLTHLDSFKDQKRLKKTKKNLKQSFWAEIYQGGLQLAGLL